MNNLKHTFSSKILKLMRNIKKYVNRVLNKARRIVGLEPYKIKKTLTSSKEQVLEKEKLRQQSKKQEISQRASLSQKLFSDFSMSDISFRCKMVHDGGAEISVACIPTISGSDAVSPICI